jgi:hypothetical protein
MPTTKSQHASTTNPATPISSVPEKQPAESARLSAFTRKVFARVKDRLETEFESFLECSTVEEQRLLIEILNDHSNRSSYAKPRSPGAYEISLYGAIERQVSNCICVVVPEDDMVPQVEEFIAALERKGGSKKRNAEPFKSPTDNEITASFAHRFLVESQLFVERAGQPSLRLMLDMLARWNEIQNDPETGKLKNILAVAAEIELDKLRAKTAAESAAA